MESARRGMVSCLGTGPGRKIRTSDTRIYSPLLWPTELSRELGLYKRTTAIWSAQPQLNRAEAVALYAGATRSLRIVTAVRVGQHSTMFTAAASREFDDLPEELLGIADATAVGPIAALEKTASGTLRASRCCHRDAKQGRYFCDQQFKAAPHLVIGQPDQP